MRILLTLCLSAILGYAFPNPFLNSIAKIVPHLDIDIEKIQKEEGYFVIKQISSFLPNFDSVGHKILHANNEMIALVINDEKIPHDLKASFILLTIKVSMMGDEMGSHILQLYYDIVKNCF